ncbi:MAG TPA: ester cyclase [Anaerolineales bacterium]|nr:ester cyclase [Anaerolineales bacterium]
MSLEENKAIVRRYQEIYNSNNLDALNEVIEENFLTPRMLPGMPPGLEGAKQIHKAALLGMPDWHTEIEDLIAEGDKVVARIMITGTHTGDFFGIPATGKKIRISGIYIARIANGKIIEHWGEEDSLGLLQQLGAIPT